MQAVPFIKSPESISGDGDIVPRIKSWRPYCNEDFQSVQKLDRPFNHLLFGNYDLGDIIELSAHRVVVENTDGAIIACICLRNYPNIPSILPEVWKECLARHYSVVNLKYENTLFVHLMLTDVRYNWDWVNYILKSLYLCLFQLQYVVIVAPPSCENTASLAFNRLGKYFYKMMPIERQHRIEGQTLYISLRDKVLPVLHIRLAVAEDNDDLMEMLDNSNPKLREIYGDYYISEMVLKATTRQIIVAECHNEPIGMMSFNSNVNLDAISAVYDLHTYRGFRKPVVKSNESSEDSEEDDDYDKNDDDNMLHHRIFNEPNTMLRERLKSECVNQDLMDVTEEVEQKTASSEYSESSDSLLDVSFWLAYQRNRLSSFDTMDEEDSDSPLAHSTTTDRQRFIHGRQTGVYLPPKAGFEGPPDCFLLELHAMRQDYDERLVLCLVQTSFEAYPDLTYCLLSMPTRQPYIPLLKYFVSVVPKANGSERPESALYVLHRNALLSSLHLRRTVPEKDAEPILEFMKSLSMGHYHASYMLEQAEEREDRFSFVILAQKQIVGVCMVKYLNDMRYLKLNYDIRSHLSSKYHDRPDQLCFLQMMILHPAFTIQLPFVVSEIFRRTASTALFYKLREHNVHSKDFICNTMLGEMIPCRPRLRVEYRLQDLRHNQYPPEYVLCNDPDQSRFALYLQTANTCTRCKSHINQRLVIVGCSTTALAFLDHLLFSAQGRSLFYSNITLISPNGFTDREFDDISELAKAFHYDRDYPAEFVRRLSFRTWVNSVYGRVTDINRKEQFVLVEHKRRVFYDRLFMFCGLQFDYPLHIKTPFKQPKNILFINNDLDAELLVVKLMHLSNSTRYYNIIVYGENRYCYTVLYLLIESKIDPAKITYIRPRGKIVQSTTTSFNDDFIDGAVETLLEQSGIEILENYDIIDWKIEQPNTITKLTVESEFNIIEMPCTLFLCLERKIVARQTIVVLNKAGLVFDGRLVINQENQTSDRNIYAAGPMTKYTRKLFVDNWRHEFVSSTEVGMRMAEMQLAELSPIQHKPKGDHMYANNVSIYRKCRVSCRPIIGGYYFVNIHRPGKPSPYALARHNTDYGRDLVTGMDSRALESGTDINYCRVHLNAYNNVETVVGLTKKPVNIYNYMAIYGLHETSVCNLKSKFDSHCISDFHEFFMQPWMYLLTHDSYSIDLRQKLRDLCVEQMVKEADLWAEYKNTIVKNKWEKLNETQRLHIVEAFVNDSFQSKAIANLVDFIAEHIDELSMFRTPQSMYHED